MHFEFATARPQRDMARRRLSLSPAVISLVLLCGASGSALASAIASFDPPGSTATYPAAINASGEIAGYYTDASNVSHGFVRASGGTITAFDVPGSSGTVAVSINDSGAVAGYYSDAKGASHGFLRTSVGQITTFNPGLAVDTVAAGINANGATTGYFMDRQGTYFGFVRTAAGKIRAFQYSNGTTKYPTYSFALNASGVTTGVWGAGSQSQGFVRRGNGAFTEIDPSGSSDTQALSVNTAGAVTGYYKSSSGFEHGFIWTASGGYTDIFEDGDTYAQAINDSAVAAGYYYDSNFIPHGYYYTLSSGAVASFDPKGSTGTFPSGINAQGAVTGSYVAKVDMKFHGFLYTP
jgi:hypothetical protein